MYNPARSEEVSATNGRRKSVFGRCTFPMQNYILYPLNKAIILVIVDAKI